MIKAIIIDDEHLARKVVKEYLKAIPSVEVVAECGDGFEAVKAIQSHQPDLIFLDIQMPKINGFETLELLDKKPEVIFTTAFDEYALKAFEQNAVDYLLKPFSPERFEKALNKFLQAHQARGENEPALKKIEALDNSPKKHSDEAHRIVVKNGSHILILPVSDVLYLEAHDDYVKVFNKETFFLKKKTMSYYEETLDPSQFVRVHRSFILNINYITKIEPLDKNNQLAVLKNGVKLPLSKTGYSKLREVLKL
ncbi:MAG: DNA-binding response regulator [Bacteroidetes bacterium]|jgi:two-component system LytT family response regulator|nr:DNA-binding response regulator [Bacteroidota bacterium]